jgi:hypothetical protein
VFFLVAILFIGSCDMLRSSPFEVSRWSPGSGFHGDPAALSLSLVFSHNPDRASVERYFSMTGDGARIKGSFSWEGPEMIFIPDAPLEINRDYILSLSADAHDDSGLSMDEAFEGRFSTRFETSRPVLVSLVPAMDAVLVDTRSEIRLVFSLAVSRDSLHDHVSLSPSMDGSWRLEDEDRTGIFTPAEPWLYGKSYLIRVSESFAGSSGLIVGRDFTSRFTIGEDHERPLLIGVRRLSGGGQLEDLVEEILGSFWENSGWERSDRLLLEFSEPVDAVSVRNSLSAEGAPPLVMESPPGFAADLIFGFETTPVHESRFAIRLKSGWKDAAGNEGEGERLYRVFADGVYSKPPVLAGIRLPGTPGSADDPDPLVYGADDLFGNFSIGSGDDQYPYSVPVYCWIECYFDTAPGALVDVFSLMERFGINTSNNVLNFSPRSISDNDFSIQDAHNGWEKYQRIEIRGFLTNTINSGVVNIEITAGLKDSLGNTSEKAFKISLLK